MSLEDVILEQGREAYKEFEIGDLQCAITTMIEYIDVQDDIIQSVSDEMDSRIDKLENMIEQLQDKVYRS